jgi:hypothetical protein
MQGEEIHDFSRGRYHPSLFSFARIERVRLSRGVLYSTDERPTWTFVRGLRRQALNLGTVTANVTPSASPFHCWDRARAHEELKRCESPAVLADKTPARVRRME